MSTDAGVPRAEPATGDDQGGLAYWGPAIVGPFLLGRFFRAVGRPARIARGTDG